MDYASCHVVYVDRTASEDETRTRDDAKSAALHTEATNHADGTSPRHASVAQVNLKILLDTFGEVHICTSGKTCIAKLHDLYRNAIVDLIPTLLLIDIPHEDHTHERSIRDSTPSPRNIGQGDGLHDSDDSGAYGLRLLQWVASEIQYQSLSKLVVPIAVVAVADNDTASLRPRGRSHLRSISGQSVPRRDVSNASPGPSRMLDQVRTMRFLDVGAVDVLTSPLLADRLPSLAVHAYRAHKEASKDQIANMDIRKNRKRSWVGLDEQKPYAYLREAMVSGLMDGICRLEEESSTVSHMAIPVSLDREDAIKRAISSWDFSAHDFSDDELLHASSLMLQHALQMPELETWRISAEKITAFLVASRSAYNAFVPYHNFRHVVDVLQATFHFLVRLGRIPKYPNDEKGTSDETFSPIAALIRPFDALTLLITAIGHDVGHPGVNNAFLVTLNAPLAQLYNDRSVLESFHCAAYSQILRRHWPVAFSGVEMRQLMINSILATDMGLHFDYMKKLGFLQEKLHENGGTHGWNGRTLEENRTLACSLLIKCADISNVARRHQVAAQWTDILTDEFARQASMEKDLGIPSTLFAPPVRETIELGKSQVGFMNMFAIPLFQGVTDVMPGMEFCVDELLRNKATWEEKVAQETRKAKVARQERIKTSHSPTRNANFGSSSRNSSPSRPANLRMQAIFNQHSPKREANGWLNSAKESSTDSLDTSPHPSPTMTLDSISPGSLVSPTSIHPRSAKPSQLNFYFPPSPSADQAGHQDFAYENQSFPPTTNGINSAPTASSSAPTITERSPTHQHHSHTSTQRSSDSTTEGSTSAVGDWTSSATSATTSKMPLSPSTQATSITSSHDQDSYDSHAHPHTHLPNQTQSQPTSSHSHSRTPTRDGEIPPPPQTSEKEKDDPDGKEHSSGVMGTVRSLRKKNSRFRMNNLGLHFWKRSKSTSPPVPLVGSGVGMGRTGSRSEGDAMEC